MLIFILGYTWKRDMYIVRTIPR